MNKFKLALQLFSVFFKIGAFTFGGGYAMIPFIQKETAEKRKWITEEEILEIIAIAESTPGPIAINSATFVGYRVAGFWGSAFATFGVVLPSFLIISIIAMLLQNFADLEPVRFAFFGIRAGVLALLFKALWTMYKKAPKNLISYIIMGASFLAVAILKINVLIVLIGCALTGLISSLIMERRKRA
ncbi:MAG: chromate transporter [Clostridia bacterium]|nr:chromate transporter [Clostridia bacterium]